MSVRRRVVPTRAVLAVVGIALTASTARAVPAAAQPSTQLWLRSQTIVVAPGTTIQLVLQLDGTVPPDAQVAVSVGRRLEVSAGEIDQLLAAGELPTPALTLERSALDQVPRDPVGRLIVTQPTAPTEGPRPTDATRLSSPGIYPVLVEVRDAEDDDLASLLTAIYRPPDGEVAALASPVSLVLPVDAPPALQADGSVSIAPEARAQLDTLATMLATTPALPATVALPPELLDQLAASANAEDVALLQRLDAATTGHQVLATPFVTLDPAEAASSGLADEYTDQLSLGEEALLSSLTNVRPDRSASVLAGATTAGLSLLRDLGVRSIVLPPDQVERVDGDPYVPTGHVLRTSTSESQIDVALAEARFLAGWTEGDDRVLAAHHVVIGLLASHLDGLVFGDITRGSVLVPPAEWAPDTVFLGTIATLLTTTPPLQPITLADWFQRVGPPPSGAEVNPVAMAAEDLTSLGERLQLERAAVAAYTSMAVSRPDLATTLEDLLRRTVADELDDGSREPYFGAVDAELQALSDAVLPVEADSFTITSRSAGLPITVRTTTEESLKVKIRLRSTKLLFPEGDVTVVVEDGSTQVDVPVESRSNGTFQVEVQLLTPFGDAPLATPTQLTVRSAGLSGLGIAVTITAVAVLALWWVHHLRRNRAAQRAEADGTKARHPTSSVDGQDDPGGEPTVAAPRVGDPAGMGPLPEPEQ